MASIVELCRFCKSFCQIQWTTTALVICAMPFTLFFIIMILVVVIIDENDGAIITKTQNCAEIGRNIFGAGGSAVDVVIAIMFCESVHSPLKAGIGGGFTAALFMNGDFRSLIATPKEPRRALEILETNNNPAGSQLAGVPGELLGYWEMHERYGLLPWEKLLEPAIELCNDLNSEKDLLIKDSQSLLNYSLTYNLHAHRLADRNNDTVLRTTVFGKTLQKIAKYGPDVFYRGELGKLFLKDLEGAGGYMTEDDLHKYRVSWSTNLVSFSLPNGLKGYTTPLPSSGALIAFVMNVIRPYAKMQMPVFWHKVVEALKHASGIGTGLGDAESEVEPANANIIRKTYSNMIDPEFARMKRDKIFDHRVFNDSSYYGLKYRLQDEGGTVQVCVIAPNGDTISMVSSLVWPGRPHFWSEKTGIVLNNHLQYSSFTTDDLPIAPGDQFRAGKRNMNTHAPVIVVDTKTFQPIFVVAAAGGGYIPSQTVAAIINFCFFRKDAHIAINSGFLRPRLDLKVVEYDPDVEENILNYLREVGNKLVNADEDLKHCSIACIANSNSFPTPRMSRRNQETGSVFIKPDLLMRVVYLMISIFLCFGVILLLIFDYFEAFRDYFYGTGDY